jgi:hypothetical protein
LFNDTEEEIKKLAIARREAHRMANNATFRFDADQYKSDIIGINGELEFAKQFNLPFNSEVKPNGEGDLGEDFVCNNKYGIKTSIDIKTYQKPYNLLIKLPDMRHIPSIYVLASFNMETKQRGLLGWEFGQLMKDTPIKDFGCYGKFIGFLSHYKPANKLRSIESLHEYLKQ